ncbi:sirohydrochlorin chelatase [Paenibacillus protaetiae]|uniref:Cobalamin biosynthesis protein CbiX n=1 Tax=Paenibacillus protaetiae TaxID=2509456 RepID=A0A4P6F1T5_9BACL|nr:CbiX/SirB N-terminal domain-containing protein [Paenibacillus protaetiae]QAY67017.1 cobalamin biosynthesis protein CbiX [Paenibacillus protaetiae]
MKQGVLVISHGSREADWIKLVDDAVNEAASSLSLSGVPVVSAFLEIVEGRLIQDGIWELERQGVTDIYVLPLFVSSGSTHVDEIAQAFGLPAAHGLQGDLEPFEVKAARVRFGQPIDDDPEVAEILLGHIRELSREPEREALLLIGHGSREAGFHERWQQGMSLLGSRLCSLGGFARAEQAMLLPDQAAEKLRGMQAERPDEAVIVVPLFLSRGYFTNHVIPGRLQGLSYRYNGKALLPHPAIAKWIARQAAAGLEGCGSGWAGSSGG